MKKLIILIVLALIVIFLISVIRDKDNENNTGDNELQEIPDIVLEDKKAGEKDCVCKGYSRRED